MSGIMQQGYSFGYVLAACANLGVGKEIGTWKTVFWIAAGLSIFVSHFYPRQTMSASRTNEFNFPI